MEKKHKIIIGSGIVFLILSFMMYLKLTKDKAIRTIQKFVSGASADAMKKMDRGYLIERAKAFDKGATDFYFKTKLYDTKTGRAKAIGTTSTGTVVKGSEAVQEEEVKRPFDIFDYETWF